jgi:hypothetical protein
LSSGIEALSPRHIALFTSEFRYGMVIVTGVLLFIEKAAPEKSLNKRWIKA